jgi:carbon monoxide dehydrogenase subunit G
MLMTLIVIVLLAVLAVLGFAASKPSTFRVARQAVIKAPPDRILGLLQDFREWSKWSPWEKLDPNLSRTMSGATSGIGAIYQWSGNKKVGQGRMEITGVTPSQVDIDLEFMAPWKARNKTVFNLTPKDGGTEVNWAMTGASPFMFKLMGLFMNMDNMIGKDFEKGLAAMKQAAETPSLTTR